MYTLYSIYNVFAHCIYTYIYIYTRYMCCICLRAYTPQLPFVKRRESSAQINSGMRFVPFDPMTDSVGWVAHSSSSLSDLRVHWKSAVLAMLAMAFPFPIHSQGLSAPGQGIKISTVFLRAMYIPVSLDRFSVQIFKQVLRPFPFFELFLLLCLGSICTLGILGIPSTFSLLHLRLVKDGNLMNPIRRCSTFKRRTR